MLRAELNSSEGTKAYQAQAWRHHGGITSSPTAAGTCNHRLLPPSCLFDLSSRALVGSLDPHRCPPLNFLLLWKSLDVDLMPTDSYQKYSYDILYIRRWISDYFCPKWKENPTNYGTSQEQKVHPFLFTKMFKWFIIQIIWYQRFWFWFRIVNSHFKSKPFEYN